MNINSVLIFALDGSTHKILDPLLKKGLLPNIADILKRGTGSRLISTIPPMTGAAWATFQTGANPGLHGIFEFIKPSGNLISSQDIKLPKLWNIIAKKGLRSCIINMPITYPVKPINGILISSLLTPPGSRFAYPKIVEEELKKLNYQLDLDEPFLLEEKSLSKPGKFQLISSLLSSRFDAINHLIKKEPWDLFFVLFKSVDLVQHFDFDGQQTTKIYQKIDTQIGKTIHKFKTKYPNQTLHIIIMSDHGFHKTASQDIALYPLLRSLKITGSIPKPLLKTARGARKTLKIKSAPGKIITFGMFEKDPLKRKSTIIKLRKAKVKGLKVFKSVYDARSLYGSALHPHIPDIIWMTSNHFSPTPDPLSDQLTYPTGSPLIGRHLSDNIGISIVSSPHISPHKIPKLKIEQLTDLICNLLKVPTPSYFIPHPFKIEA